MSDMAKVQDLTWYAEVPRSIWRHTMIGMVLIVVTFGGGIAKVLIFHVIKNFGVRHCSILTLRAARPAFQKLCAPAQ